MSPRSAPPAADRVRRSQRTQPEAEKVVGHLELDHTPTGNEVKPIKLSSLASVRDNKEIERPSG